MKQCVHCGSARPTLYETADGPACDRCYKSGGEEARDG